MSGAARRGAFAGAPSMFPGMFPGMFWGMFLGVFLAVLCGPAGAAAYILYYRTFGDWAVVCWRGMAQGEQSCYIDAPPIQFNTDPFTSQLRIEPAAGAVQITVSARSGTRTGTKVRLAVDGQTLQEGQSDRIDHVSFSGAAAAALIEAFRGGKSLAVEFPDLKRQMRLSLAGFDEAFAAFKENLDRFAPAAPTPPASESSSSGGN
jgi:invasion protein IalB